MVSHRFDVSSPRVSSWAQTQSWEDIELESLDVDTMSLVRLPNSFVDPLI
jgi:hypothetical protein